MDRIIVAGSLNPDKDCQDRVRVLFWGGGYLSITQSDRLKGSSESGGS